MAHATWAAAVEWSFFGVHNNGPAVQCLSSRPRDAAAGGWLECGFVVYAIWTRRLLPLCPVPLLDTPTARRGGSMGRRPPGRQVKWRHRGPATWRTLDHCAASGPGVLRVVTAVRGGGGYCGQILVRGQTVKSEARSHLSHGHQLHVQGEGSRQAERVEGLSSWAPVEPSIWNTEPRKRETFDPRLTLLTKPQTPGQMKSCSVPAVDRRGSPAIEGEVRG